MLYLAGHDDEFAFADDGFVIAEFHAQGAFDDQEELVFVIVMMPEKFAFEFNGFYVAIVDLADDMGLVLLGEESEFLLQVDGFHDCSYRFFTSADTPESTRLVVSGLEV